MKRRLLIVVALGIFAASPALAGNVRAAGAPSLGIDKVLPLAKEFLKDKKLNLTGRYISSVTLQYDATAKTRYWLVQWQGEQPRLGMEYGLRVGMDGKVSEQMTGP